MSEIRITVSERLDNILDDKAKNLGVKKTEYCKTLILNELRKEGVDINE